MTYPKTFVIGAGIVGAMLTHCLSCAGLPVHVIEQAEPGMGVTAHSSGWVNWITADPVADPSRYTALQEAFEHYDRLNDAFAGKLIGQRSGALRWLAEQGQTETMIAAHQRAGSPVEVVQGVRLRKLAPMLADPPPLAAYSPDDFLIDARAATTRLLDDAMARGACVRTQAEALAIGTQAGRVSSLRVDDDDLEADLVIVAAGTATNALLEPFGVDKPIDTSPAALIRFATDNLTPGPIIAGPGLEAHIHAPNSITVAKSVPDNEADDPLTAQRLGEEAKRRLRNAFTDLKNLQLVASTIGNRPLPSCGKPLVGPVHDVDGLYTAVAHPGVILAPAIADNITHMVLQRLN